MNWRRLLTVATVALPVAIAWWTALVPAAAQAARCAGVLAPWPSAAESMSACGATARERRLELLQQAYQSPTPTPAGASPTPYVAPTRPPGQTATPTLTPPAGATATPTRTQTPTATRTVTPTGSPVATNTNTATPAPGTPTATRTVTPVFTPTRPAGTPTATLVPGAPTATVGLPRTGDGTYRGESDSNAGLLLAGGAVVAFSVALVVRARRSRHSTE